MPRRFAAERERLAGTSDILVAGDREADIVVARSQFDEHVQRRKIRQNAARSLLRCGKNMNVVGTAAPLTGFVSLVGAGPGDPALLTRAAIVRLRTADAVLYDALVDQRVLKFARRARKIFVGKRVGCHAMTQETIHALMLGEACRGSRVVRLKGGDPFLFGRGGEEAMRLQQAGVPYEIVPGVTSAIAAPALAGIPVTHRSIASALLIVSGHDDLAFAMAIGSVQPETVTLVVLMGHRRAAALASHLLNRGWDRETPAAVVVSASTSDQQAWRGRLCDLAADGCLAGQDGPGTIIVGRVAALGLEPAPLRVGASNETAISL